MLPNRLTSTERIIEVEDKEIKAFIKKNNLQVGTLRKDIITQQKRLKHCLQLASSPPAEVHFYAKSLLQNKLHQKLIQVFQAESPLKMIEAQQRKNADHLLEKIYYFEESVKVKVSKHLLAFKKVLMKTEEDIANRLKEKKLSLITAIQEAFALYRKELLNGNLQSWQQTFLYYGSYFTQIPGINFNLLTNYLAQDACGWQTQERPPFDFDEDYLSSLSFEHLVDWINHFVDECYRVKDFTPLCFIEQSIRECAAAKYIHIEKEGTFISTLRRVVLLKNDAEIVGELNAGANLDNISEQFDEQFVLSVKKDMQQIEHETNEFIKKLMIDLALLENELTEATHFFKTLAESIYQEIAQIYFRLKKSITLAKKEYQIAEQHAQKIQQTFIRILQNNGSDSALVLDDLRAKQYQDLKTAEEAFHKVIFENIGVEKDLLEKKLGEANTCVQGKLLTEVEKRVTKQFERMENLRLYRLEIEKTLLTVTSMPTVIAKTVGLAQKLPEIKKIFNEVDQQRILLTTLLQEYDHWIHKSDVFVQVGIFKQGYLKRAQEKLLAAENLLFYFQQNIQKLQQLKKEFDEEAATLPVLVQLELQKVTQLDTKINVLLKNVITVKTDLNHKIMYAENIQEQQQMHYALKDAARTMQILLLQSILQPQQAWRTAYFGGVRFAFDGRQYHLPQGVADILFILTKYTDPQQWLSKVTQVARDRQMQSQSWCYKFFRLRHHRTQAFYQALASLELSAQGCEILREKLSALR